MSYGWAKDAEALAQQMPDDEPPIGWKQVAANYRDDLYAVRRRSDELQRRLSRRSVDDVYLLIGVALAVVLILVLLFGQVT